ncbi:hypothetical protein RUND412_011370, partial [Rhizina undulata]
MFNYTLGNKVALPDKEAEEANAERRNKGKQALGNIFQAGAMAIKRTWQQNILYYIKDMPFLKH